MNPRRTSSTRRWSATKEDAVKKSITVIAVLLLAASSAWAKAGAPDGATIYKSKCAGCHGAQGQGKMGPKLAGTTLSEDDIVKVLTTGGEAKPPHVKAFKGATPEKAKAVAAYIKTLQ